MTVCDKKCEICTIGTVEKCGLCAPECNKEILVQRAADGAATAESDVNYRLHATFGAVASNQVKDVMDLIVKVVAFEITAAEERVRAEEAAKYKPLVALASRVPDPCKGCTCKCESNCRWKKEWLAMRDIIAALKSLEEKK